MEFSTEIASEHMPSLNHSYVALEITRQLLQNPHIMPLPELTLDIDKGITPDISVFNHDEIQPNFRRDEVRFSLLPKLAIEIVPPSQHPQYLVSKASLMISAGVPTVWTVDPFTETVIVSDSSGDHLTRERLVKTGDIQVDFDQIFGV